MCRPPLRDKELIVLFIVLFSDHSQKRAALGGHRMGWGKLLVAARDSLEEKLLVFLFILGCRKEKGGEKEQKGKGGKQERKRI